MAGGATLKCHRHRPIAISLLGVLLTASQSFELLHVIRIARDYFHSIAFHFCLYYVIYYWIAQVLFPGAREFFKKRIT